MEELIRNNIDIFLFSETKLDETFPNQQFKIRGHNIKFLKEIETNKKEFFKNFLRLGFLIAIV